MKKELISCLKWIRLQILEFNFFNDFIKKIVRYEQFPYKLIEIFLPLNN